MRVSFRKTRLAPSPTGAPHLGHARTFLITWCMARQADARLFMRMEDLDIGRAKLESVIQAYEDLRWLGIDWDPYDGRNEVVQSHRLPLYRQTLEHLWKQRKIYPCTCTRADIVAAVSGSASAPHEGEGNVRYPGTCRALADGIPTMNVAETERTLQERTGKNVCWRLRAENGNIRFEDAIAGPQEMDVEKNVGDFPLTRFDGTPAYQLACVVDDHAMEIDCVVRGDDLLSSTPRQIMLYRAMGWQPPRFGHVPLVVGTDGKRLAKRHGESRIAQFREAGLPPEKIIGWAAWRSGQIADPREMAANEVLKQFDVQKLPKNRVILTPDDLAWLQ